MKRIEFKIPAGFTVPEGTSAGDDFQEMATFRVKPGGTMCLVAIGEHKMPGYGKDEGKSTMQMRHEMGEKAAGRYMGMMNGAGGGY